MQNFMTQFAFFLWEKQGPLNEKSTGARKPLGPIIVTTYNQLQAEKTTKPH